MVFVLDVVLLCTYAPVYKEQNVSVHRNVMVFTETPEEIVKTVINLLLLLEDIEGSVL